MLCNVMFLANSTMPQPLLDQCTIMLQNTNPFEPLSEQSSHGKPVTSITDKFTSDTDNIVAMNKADTQG